MACQKEGVDKKKNTEVDFCDNVITETGLVVDLIVKMKWVLLVWIEQVSVEGLYQKHEICILNYDMYPS